MANIGAKFSYRYCKVSSLIGSCNPWQSEEIKCLPEGNGFNKLVIQKACESWFLII